MDANCFSSSLATCDSNYLYEYLTSELYCTNGSPKKSINKRFIRGDTEYPEFIISDVSVWHALRVKVHLESIHNVATFNVVFFVLNTIASVSKIPLWWCLSIFFLGGEGR